MNVGGFPSHGVEQAEFGIGDAQGSEFDAGAVRTEAASDPASAKLDERIGTADGVVDDHLIENFGRACVLLRFAVGLKILGPMRSRRDKRFGLAVDAAAVPAGDGDVAGVAEAA